MNSMIADATERCEETARRGGHGVCVEVRGHRHVKSSNETHADLQGAHPGLAQVLGDNHTRVE